MSLNQASSLMDTDFETASYLGTSRASSPHMDEGSEATGTSHPRYKTEMCKNFTLNGTCSYGNTCQFAHSVCELRVSDRSMKYKTDHCRTWRQKGECPYGSRCLFIHSETEHQLVEMRNKIALEHATRGDHKKEDKPAVHDRSLLTSPVQSDSALLRGGDLALGSVSAPSVGSESMDSSYSHQQLEDALVLDDLALPPMPEVLLPETVLVKPQPASSDAWRWQEEPQGPLAAMFAMSSPLEPCREQLWNHTSY